MQVASRVSERFACSPLPGSALLVSWQRTLLELPFHCQAHTCVICSLPQYENVYTHADDTASGM